MAHKKQKSEDIKNTNSVRSPDPELEKKVDAMMDVGSKSLPTPEPPKVEPPVLDVPIESAPLLPSEKLKILEEPTQSKKKKVLPQLAPFVPSTPKTSEQEVPIEPIEPQTTATSADTLHLQDPETDKLVDEIVADEADRLLAAEDQAAGAVLPPLLTAAPRPTSKLKTFFKAWWGNKRYRRLTYIGLLIIAAGLLITPSSRYFVLNTAGVRASTSLTVVDTKTNQPLKNVVIGLSGKTTKTNKDGQARLQQIKLGSQILTVRKVGFAESRQSLTIGWGSNPQGSVKILAVGSRYTLNLRDFLSDKPIAKAEATSGEASARANGRGELVLTVPQTEAPELEIRVTADNHRTEILKIPNQTKSSQTIKMSPARKVVFVSKRAGKYDIYKIDADGQNEQKLLAGTGTEQPDTMALAPHPSKEIVGFVATRDNVRNKDGFLLSTLNLINISDGAATKLGQSERIQILGWVGDRLIYVKIAEGESAASPKRHRLISYDLSAKQEKELASTNYFNDVMIAGGVIYYSPAIYKINGAIGFFRIDPDGSSKKTISPKEAWNLFRTNFDTISVSLGQEWYEYHLPDGKFTKASGAPPALASRLYVEGPDNKRSLWSEDRDGKGTLLAYDHAKKSDKVLHAQSGLKTPIRWLDDDHLIFRVAGSSETADYVMSLSGGQPKKIADVTNIAGAERWYYY